MATAKIALLRTLKWNRRRGGGEGGKLDSDMIGKGRANQKRACPKVVQSQMKDTKRFGEEFFMRKIS
jgi:hypothetical protein